jgi:hypothetical protein
MMSDDGGELMQYRKDYFMIRFWGAAQGKIPAASGFIAEIF